MNHRSLLFYWSQPACWAVFDANTGATGEDGKVWGSWRGEEKQRGERGQGRWVVNLFVQLGGEAKTSSWGFVQLEKWSPSCRGCILELDVAFLCYVYTQNKPAACRFPAASGAVSTEPNWAKAGKSETEGALWHHPLICTLCVMLLCVTMLPIQYGS